jgi:hypothetical protein
MFQVHLTINLLHQDKWTPFNMLETSKTLVLIGKEKREAHELFLLVREKSEEIFHIKHRAMKKKSKVIPSVRVSEFFFV